MSLSEDLYKELIIEHTQEPSHRDIPADHNLHEEGVNRSCGDEVEVFLKVEDGVIKAIGIGGHGCSISTASGSMMADAVDGITVEQAEDLIEKFKAMIVEKQEAAFPEGLEDLEAFKGVQQYPIRVKCATLAWNTLEHALKKAGAL
ncbi:MAG: SUF system NifU family Fe-S cluster assembly protein [Leptospiraceae bacterium]|nr:SUF system NifU family Fe-S cluster assembly protein [Leptospiraceae bacterium]